MKLLGVEVSETVHRLLIAPDLLRCLEALAVVRLVLSASGMCARDVYKTATDESVPASGNYGSPITVTTKNARAFCIAELASWQQRRR